MADIASKGRKKEEAADFAAGFGRLAAEMLENAHAMPVHPLMAHPAAAVAAATAIGFGFSTQMAGAFFGAWQ
ncbi:5' DNA nuclease, partial [Rhizobium ruizarguesonis]